ncbi:MAG TPA: DsbA family oxidoreductase [Chitinophagales bacterium]|nr:DsbA family oxidoreductase [Chitinophagales bacterium]
MSNTNKNKLHVEVWSDIVCPFCYIGKRNYEQALADFAHSDDLVVEFKSYQLDPEFIQDPNKKSDQRAELARKYKRTPEQIDAMYQQIEQSAKSVGLEYHLDQAIRFNTFDAHRIGQVAKEKGIDEQYYENLFRAYFTEGKDLGNQKVLKKEAMQSGLIEADIEKALEGDDYAYKVKQDIAEGANLGVTGVPFFVFNRRYGVSGAQPPQLFLETMQMAYDDWKKSDAPQLKTVGDSDAASCDVDGNCD